MSPKAKTREGGRERGYENFLEALDDPGHEEHEIYQEWFDGEFDAEAFSLEAINIALLRVK